MVVIQCPHCREDVELEDGVFGLFACPYCDEEFDYESGTNSGLNTTMKGFWPIIWFYYSDTSDLYF